MEGRDPRRCVTHARQALPPAPSFLYSLSFACFYTRYYHDYKISCRVPITFLECFLLTHITQSSTQLQTASSEICMWIASSIYRRLVLHSRTQTAVIETWHPGEHAMATMAFHSSPFKLRSNIIQCRRVGYRSQRYSSHNIGDGLHAACYCLTPFVRRHEQDWIAYCSFLSNSTPQVLAVFSPNQCWHKGHHFGTYFHICSSTRPRPGNRLLCRQSVGFRSRSLIFQGT